MVQDIVVHISLDTKATPRESLIPLILSLEGAKSYKEYATLDALLADYAATTAAGKAGKALYANAEERGNAPEPWRCWDLLHRPQPKTLLMHWTPCATATMIGIICCPPRPRMHR